MAASSPRDGGTTDLTHELACPAGPGLAKELCQRIAKDLLARHGMYWPS
ncbi:MAG: hypothetical protein J7J88_00295 [Dehalococcoidia bacterium]|nr:hypothetical protein [Dehalococcoidia bacterium]